MENAPSSAAYILERGPPLIGIPPNTIAISIFIPTDEPDEAESVGVSTVMANAASPIPMPASAKQSTVSDLGRIPESLAQTGFPPRNRACRPIGSR